MAKYRKNSLSTYIFASEEYEIPFVEHNDDKTLLLIDEFGSGTEPQIGRAIAENIVGKIQTVSTVLDLLQRTFRI